MTDVTTTRTCDECGLHYRESLIPHQCAEWTKGRTSSPPSISYRCPNCYGVAEHDKDCPGNPVRYEQESHEQPASAAGSGSVPQRLSLTDDYEGVVSEFDKVFAEMEAPDYPATCDNCGAEGTNATMEQHECQLPAPAAPETGENGLIDGDLTVRQHGDRYLLVNESDWPVAEMYNEQEAEQLTTEHNSHHSLIAEWERLVEALKQIHAALPNGIRLTPTETKIATIVADALSDINQKGSGSE